MTLDPKLAAFIATRDRMIAVFQPWNTTPLKDYFATLLKDGLVIVGGRTSCGGKVDPTWKIFAAWGEVVRKARKLGYQISDLNIPQKNGSPTRSGGYWDEYEYRLSPSTKGNS